MGEPRRGAPAFRPLAAVSFPQRLNLGDVKEFIKLKTARARVTGSENRRKALLDKALQNRLVCETTIVRCVKHRVYPQKKVCETPCPSTVFSGGVCETPIARGV